MNLRFAQTRFILVENGAGPMVPRRVWGLFLALALLLLATALTLQVNAAPPADPPPPAWTIVASPNVSGRDNRLLGVAAISANDVWAVGNSAVTTTPAAAWTLTTHWDGTSWSQVSSPSPGQWHTLNGVSARASNDVWAVGSFFSSGSGSSTQSLILHWDGSAWSQVPSPNYSGSSTTYLYAVAARASNDAWAVGSTTLATTGGAMVIAHWNGTSWDLVATPPSGSNQNMLTGVAALSANDAWAVGHYYLNSRFHTLLEHWDGSTWSIVPGPNLGAGVDGYVQSVTML